MTSSVTRIAGELADREAIRECLARYARGIDRLDAAMVRSAYWPDCIDEHLNFRGNTEEFIEWSFSAMGGMDQTMHFITNVLMTINGASADVESYFYGIHRINGTDGGKRDVVGAGRYVDKFLKRDDEWRIKARLVVTDWFREYGDSADWSKGLMGIPIEPGARFPDDESYKRLSLRF